MCLYDSYRIALAYDCFSCRSSLKEHDTFLLKRICTVKNRGLGLLLLCINTKQINTLMCNTCALKIGCTVYLIFVALFVALARNRISNMRRKKQFFPPSSSFSICADDEDERIQKRNPVVKITAKLCVSLFGVEKEHTKRNKRKSRNIDSKNVGIWKYVSCASLTGKFFANDGRSCDGPK